MTRTCYGQNAKFLLGIALSFTSMSCAEDSTSINGNAPNRYCKAGYSSSWFCSMDDSFATSTYTYNSISEDYGNFNEAKNHFDHACDGRRDRRPDDLVSLVGRPDTIDMIVVTDKCLQNKQANSFRLRILTPIANEREYPSSLERRERCSQHVTTVLSAVGEIEKSPKELCLCLRSDATTWTRYSEKKIQERIGTNCGYTVTATGSRQFGCDSHNITNSISNKRHYLFYEADVVCPRNFPK